MDVKMEFIARLNRGERMSDLCREYGIARKTGHKLKNRYAERGEAGLEEESRAPLFSPRKTREEVVELVVAERRAHPTWGPKKVKDVLEKRLKTTLPSCSTIGTILDRAGLVTRRRKRRAPYRPVPSHLSVPVAPNDLWCIDYKGQFRLGDQSLCYPLTVTDEYCRFLLGIDGMDAISNAAARESCQELFRQYGLPSAIRSDNGPPFASVGVAGLSELSVYFLRLGIRLERIRPGHPEENTHHERMHWTLKRETARPARRNLLQQQERFDEFREEFNVERPHEALGMKRPAELYIPSARRYPASLPEPAYSTHDDVVLVRKNGFIPFPGGRREVHLTAALRGQRVGLREEEDGRWLVSFMALDLGHIERNRAFTPMGQEPQAK